MIHSMLLGAVIAGATLAAKTSCQCTMDATHKNHLLKDTFFYAKSLMTWMDEEEAKESKPASSKRAPASEKALASLAPWRARPRPDKSIIPDDE